MHHTRNNRSLCDVHVLDGGDRSGIVMVNQAPDRQQPLVTWLDVRTGSSQHHQTTATLLAEIISWHVDTPHRVASELPATSPGRRASHP
jgi:hypothetical protein